MAVTRKVLAVSLVAPLACSLSINSGAQTPSDSWFASPVARAERQVRQYLGRLDSDDQRKMAFELGKSGALYKKEAMGKLEAAQYEQSKGNSGAFAILKRESDDLASLSLASLRAASVLRGEIDELISPDRVQEQIIVLTNPALPTCASDVTWHGAFPKWAQEVDNFLARNAWVLGSVGRVELSMEEYQRIDGKLTKVAYWMPIGTAFVVGPGKLATAYHVVQVHHDAVSGKPTSRLQVNMGSEYSCPKSAARFSIVAVKPVDGLRDLALLETAEEIMLKPLEIEDKDTYRSGEVVFAIGYPSNDIRVPHAKSSAILAVDDQGVVVYDVKRLQPGEIPHVCVGMRPFEMGHTASTLGNSSGSPILRATTGKVVGVNTGGRPGICNYGTRGSFLKTLSSPQ